MLSIPSSPRVVASPATAEGSIDTDFACPLTLCLMVQPCTTEHGITYERSAIAKVLEQPNARCPITRQDYKSQILPPVNIALRNAIERADPAGYRAAKRDLEAELNRLAPAPVSPPGAAPDQVPLLPSRRKCHIATENLVQALFLLGNPAGRAHERLSRARLREKCESSRSQLDARDGPPDTARQAALVGKAAYYERRLQIADGAAGMTRVVDGVLGTYKSPSEIVAGYGVVGSASLAAGCLGAITVVGWLVTMPAAGVVSQAASLAGAGVKASIAGASYFPAKMAQRRAKRQFMANLGA